MSGSFSFETFGNGLPEGDRLFTIFMVIYLIFAAILLAYGAVVYVLQSLGLYTIAKRRCIHHSWLAWIPIGNMWLLGSISDQYQYVAKGKIRNRRKVLLGLLIPVYVLLIAVVVIFMALSVTSVNQNVVTGTVTGTTSVLGVLGVYMIAWAVSIVATVFMYIAYYDLFASCNPSNAVVFLVLSIFFNFLLPFFVFACRKKDEGMPPRKILVPVAPWTPQEQPEPQEEPKLPEEPAFPDVTEEDFEPEE